MIFGYPTRGLTVTLLEADTAYVSKYNLPDRAYVQKITALLDGLGDGIGAQSVRAVIYDTSGNLVSASAVQIVPDNAPLAWVDFSFRFTAQSPGIALDAGDYLIGIDAGAPSESARIWGTPDVVNLVPNPSFEIDTTSWTQNAATGSAVRDPAVSYVGAASLHQTNPGRNANEGASTTSLAVDSNITFTASVFVKGSAVGTPLAIELQERTSTDTLVGATAQTFSTTGDWQEVSVLRAFGSRGAKARIVVRTTATAASDYWLDAAMLVEDTATHPYFDGDTIGHVWLGTPHSSSSAVGKSYTDTFTDGPLTAIPRSTAASPELSLFASYTLPYRPPAGVDDEYLASLPFDAAEAALGDAQPIATSQVEAQCGWHGTLIDPDRGMVALVNTGGPLADLVGERVRLSYDERTLVVYVTAERDLLDDISLTRRGFMALETAATTSIAVTVETLGSVT